MVNKWIIHPGEAARLWDKCKENSCIAIGWENDNGFAGFGSLDDLKNAGHGTNDAKSIWYFYKDIQIGDIVIATTSVKTVLGIGKIKSEYIPPGHPENPGIEYKNVRLVEWLITEELEVKNLSTRFPQKAVTPEYGERWEEIKKGYIQKNSKYKEIFDKLELLTTSLPVSTSLGTLENLLWDKHQIILHGPPGTGKTHIARKIAINFCKKNEELKL